MPGISPRGAATNLTRGSFNAVLNEMDDVTLRNLRQGRIVKFPNGMSFRPVGNKDGEVKVKVRFSQAMAKLVNKDFRGQWINAEIMGKSEAEMTALWNETCPDDPIEELP